MTQSNKGNEEPKEPCKRLAGPVNDPLDEEADGDLNKADAYIVHDLRPGTPLQGVWDPFRRKTVYMLTNTGLDHLCQEHHSNESKKLNCRKHSNHSW